MLIPYIQIFAIADYFIITDRVLLAIWFIWIGYFFYENERLRIMLSVDYKPKSVIKKDTSNQE